VRLYEHEAKQLYEGDGIPIPRSYGLVRSLDDFEALEPAFPVMVKAMVLTGGRGKRGGIRKVEEAGKARSAVERMLGMTLGEYPVEAILVEEAVNEKAAFYLGVTMNPQTYEVVVLASALGGVDIEQAARENPDAVLRRHVPGNEPELPADAVAEVSGFLAKGLDDAPTEAIEDVVAKLYRLFQAYDCKVAEVNPLIVTEEGAVVAADAKVVIDDNALYRQRKIFRLLGLTDSRHDSSELTPDERRAREAGFPYVDLLPENHAKDPAKLYVGLVPGGAGYGIFSIDETANIGERFFDGRVVPVNFMDSGGGPPEDRVAEMFHLLMDKEAVDLVITSRFGGISSCDVFIRGLIRCLRDRHATGRRVVRVQGRMVGTDLPNARAFLERARAETPKPLEMLDIVIGNQKIMADVIKDGVAQAFRERGN